MLTNDVAASSTGVQTGVGSPLGASKLSGFEPLDDEVERFLASLRFEHREKLAELPIDLTDE
jgi:hypothetical protein